MKHIQAPVYYRNDNETTVFLAGSIDMGNCDDWQSGVVERFEDKDVVFYNPRRSDWDSTWGQTVEDENTVIQINWELDWMEQVDIIFMYLDPATKAPISLLELGLFSDENIIVCCPDGYHRQANVEIVCHRNGILFFRSLEEALVTLGENIDMWSQSRYNK